MGILVSQTSFPLPDNILKPLFPVTLSWADQCLTVGALVDSGSDGSIIDITLAKQAGIALKLLDKAIFVEGISGRSLGTITHCTEPITLSISGNHVENIRFLVMHSPDSPVILGRTWILLHDPHISWSTGRILGWSVACHANCLRSAPSPSSNPLTELSPPDLTGVPPAYHDLAPVFSKDSALSLPPHRPYDCPIDLLPGATLPVGRLYNLSVPEKEAMRNYISNPWRLAS